MTNVTLHSTQRHTAFFFAFSLFITIMVATNLAYAQIPAPQPTQPIKKTIPQTKSQKELLDLYTPHSEIVKKEQKSVQPHRTTGELATWLSGVIMLSLDMKAEAPRKNIDDVKQYFTKPAYKDYLTFLSEQSYWIFVTQRKYNMNAASTRLPALLCKQE